MSCSCSDLKAKVPFVSCDEHGKMYWDEATDSPSEWINLTRYEEIVPLEGVSWFEVQWLEHGAGSEIKRQGFTKDAIDKANRLFDTLTEDTSMIGNVRLVRIEQLRETIKGG